MKFEESKDLIKPPELPSNLLSSSSWTTVKNFERMIDSYGLRKIARTPFMLKVIVEVLSRIIPENISEQAPLEPKTLTGYQLIEQFIDNAIFLNAQLRLAALTKKESDEDANKLEKDKTTINLATEIRQQLQSLALELSRYSSNPSISTALKIKVEHSLLESNSLLECNENNSNLRFHDSLIMEYLVAEQIREELVQLTAASLVKEKLMIQKELLLNQHLLNLRASQNMTIQILCNAVKEKKISTDLLYNIIDLSRQKQKISDASLQMRVEDEELQMKDEEELKHDIVGTIQQQSKQLITEKRLNDNISKENYFQFQFEVAAANAITILNMTGFDFSNYDLSNICVKGAYLSYGVFEGTNFANAKLQRVIFTGTWLKDANFERANLQGVDFGEDSDLKIQDDFIAGMLYSRNGRYFAVDIGNQTVLYENLGSRYSSFKRVKNFPGNFPTIARCCLFSFDSKQLVTLSANQISIWDIESGELWKKFDIDYKTVLNISPNMDYAIFHESQDIEIYSIKRDLWIKLLSTSGTNEFISFDTNFSQPNFFVLGVENRGILLYNYVTGMCILKQRQQNINLCKCNSNGKQIASKEFKELVCISDIVRGHTIKALKYQDENHKYENTRNSIPSSLKFEGDLLLYGYGSFFYIFDIASVKAFKRSLDDITQNDTMSSLHPRDGIIAVKKNKNTITFNNLYQEDSAVHKENTNHKGLNLEGVIANLSVGVSEENIGIFVKKGEYHLFDEITIRGLFSNSLSDLSETINNAEISLVSSSLTILHVKIIDSYAQWSTLKKLNLAENSIGDEGGEIIASNKSWVNLEELTLRQTEIGDKSAVLIGSNQIWKYLTKLDLSENSIGDEGAISIAGNDVWKNLAILNLNWNKILYEGIVSIIANKTWIHLQRLELYENPPELEEKELLEIIKNIPSTKLQKLTVPKIWLDRELLQIFKYSVPESVKEILLGGKKYESNVIGLIARNGTWTGLKKLDLSDNEIEDEVGVEIIYNLTWIDIEEINLSKNELGEISGNALAENKNWKKLRKLNLSSNKIEDKIISIIGKNDCWKNLHGLDLSNNKIGAEGAVALSQNMSWTSLTSIDLGDNNIGDEGALALSKNVSWTNLTSLNLNGNNISVDGAAALSKCKLWTNLTSLDLEKNSIGDEGAAALSKNVSWGNLTSLNLSGNNICAEGAVALSENLSWINLASLHLSWNYIGDEGAAALSKNVSWTTLTSLDLRGNNIGAEGAVALSENVSWINLTSLDLSRNDIREEGAAALSKNMLWTNLTSLNLQENSIGAEGAVALSENLSWPNLTSLNLSENDIGSDGAVALSKNVSWIALTSLNLWMNYIDDEGAVALSKNVSWPNLTSLNLWMNYIDDEGAAALSKNVSWINLTSLNLERNSIGDEGAAALSKNVSWPNLTLLNLQENNISDEGAAALSKNVSWTNLTSLRLFDNDISADGARALIKRWPNISLEY